MANGSNGSAEKVRRLRNGICSRKPGKQILPLLLCPQEHPRPRPWKWIPKAAPDALTLDVRAADAAGISYGVWRAREDDRKRKAKETIRRQIEERKKKHGESKDQLAAHEHESRG